MEELENSSEIENENTHQTETRTVSTKRKMLIAISLLIVLSIPMLIFAIFHVRDKADHATFTQDAAERVDDAQEIVKKNQLPFIEKVHFPNTSRFSVKPDPESSSSFIVRDDKGLSLYDVDTASITSISLYDVVPNLKLGDYTKVGRLILFVTGEGISVYDLDTSKTQIYSTQDGLADKSNIRFHPDPYDSNIVWIGTFRGLSKFDLSSRTFQSYTREIGIPGSIWEPKVFYIDQNTVWVTVAANAYNTGGVARLNKNTGEWMAWGTETFVIEGEVNSRVDPVNTSVGSENYIVIEEDDTEYVFDRELQSWSVLRTFDRAEPTTRGLHLDEDWFYFTKQQKLQAYNITSQETRTIDYTQIYNSRAGTGLSMVDIAYDEIYDRYILQPSSILFVEHPYVVTFRAFDSVPEDVQLLTFAGIYNRYQYTDAQILDVQGNEMVIKTRDGVVLYDLQKYKPSFELSEDNLLSHGFDVKAKLYPNTLIVHVAEYCDAMCQVDTGYAATTTVWNRETGQLELIDSFNSTNYGWRIVWNEESVGISLHNSYTKEPQSFTLNLTNRTYQETTEHLEFDNKYYIDYGEFVPFESSSDVQYVKRNINEDRNILKVKTTRPNGTDEIHRITLPMLVNAFGINPGYEVTDAILNEDVAWFLTDRGLVKFNTETKQWKIYSSEDGLTQDEGSKLYISGNQLIIDNSLGVTIYQYTEKLN